MAARFMETGGGARAAQKEACVEQLVRLLSSFTEAEQDEISAEIQRLAQDRRQPSGVHDVGNADPTRNVAYRADRGDLEA